MKILMQNRRLNALFLIMIYLLCFTFMSVPVSAKETEDEFGWVEVRATVPTKFDGEIYVLLENQETFNTYDFFIVAINNFVASEKIPAGDYVVSFAYVYQNSNYKVSVDVDKLTVSSEGAATVLNAVVTNKNAVETPVVNETIESPEPSEVPNVETPSPDDTSDASQEGSSVEDSEVQATPTPTPIVSDPPSSSEVEEGDDSVDNVEEESSPIFVFLTKIIGTGIFIAVVFAVVYFVREHTKD